MSVPLRENLNGKYFHYYDDNQNEIALARTNLSNVTTYLITNIESLMLCSLYMDRANTQNLNDKKFTMEKNEKSIFQFKESGLGGEIIQVNRPDGISDSDAVIAFGDNKRWNPKDQ